MESTTSAAPTGRGWMGALRGVYDRADREIRGWKAALKLFRDPSRLDQVFELDEVLDEESVRPVLEAIRSHERGRAALASRPRVGALDLDDLSRLAPGSVGRSYAEHMRRLGLDPAAIPEKEVWDDASYARAHLYETHDLWHVVTGFEADIAGEVGLQAFYAAQLHGRLPPVLVSGGLLHGVLTDPGDWERRLASVVRGYEMGKRAELLFGVVWRAELERPLEDLQRHLGLA
ncbi:MAG: hypothetical protein HOV80_16660 [Polyangiaceae bacterium]|nr:hypothetical protein [Polyangiaceae bacterium]